MSQESSPPSTASQLLQLLQLARQSNTRAGGIGRRKSKPRAAPAIGANGRRLQPSEWLHSAGYDSDQDEDIPLEAISPPWPVHWVPGFDYGTPNLDQSGQALFFTPTSSSMTLEPHCAYIAPHARLSISMNNPFPLISMRDAPPPHLLSSILLQGDTASALQLPTPDLFTSYLPAAAETEWGEMADMVREMATEARESTVEVENGDERDTESASGLIHGALAVPATMDIDEDVFDLLPPSDDESEAKEGADQNTQHLAHPKPSHLRTSAKRKSEVVQLPTETWSAMSASAPPPTAPRTTKPIVFKRSTPIPALVTPPPDSLPSTDTTPAKPEALPASSHAPIPDFAISPISAASAAHEPDEALPSVTDETPPHNPKKRAWGYESDDLALSDDEKPGPKKRRAHGDSVEWTDAEIEFLRTHCDVNAERQKWTEICALMNRELGTNKNTVQCSKFWYRLRRPTGPTSNKSTPASSGKRGHKTKKPAPTNDPEPQEDEYLSEAIAEEEIDEEAAPQPETPPQPVHSEPLEEAEAVGGDEAVEGAVKTQSSPNKRKKPRRRRILDSRDSDDESWEELHGLGRKGAKHRRRTKDTPDAASASAETNAAPVPARRARKPRVDTDYLMSDSSEDI